MEPFNPYAPPVAAGTGALVSGQGSFHVVGETLIVNKGTTLPKLCLFDGSPVSGNPIEKKLSWAPTWVTVLVVFSPLIYIIAYLVTRKTGALSYYLGEEARRRRTSGIVMLVGSFVALFLLMFIAIAADSVALLLVGFLAFFVLLIVGVVRTKIFLLTRIDDHTLQFKLKPAAAAAFARFSGGLEP